jgi:hypothetical protein
VRQSPAALQRKLAWRQRLFGRAFVVAEDNRMGDFRWLLVSAPGTPASESNLKLAETPAQRSLVGKQGGGAPVFALATSGCRRDYEAMKARGVAFDGEPQTMPYGTGVTLSDVYGNKLYLNEDPR